MIHWKRACMIGMACGVSLAFVAGRVSKTQGHRPVAASAYVQGTEDRGISQKEKDLLQDLIRKIKHDKDPLQGLPDPMPHYRLPEPPSYTVDPYIRAAVALQASSPEQARNALLSLARENRDRSMEVSILCRMLFIGKGKQPLKRLFFGQDGFPGGTEPRDWPLNPVALVDEIPFFLPRGITIYGYALQPKIYLQYCFREGKWNPYRFHLKTVQEKQQALKKLLASPKWKTPLGPDERDFLSDQIR